MRAPCLASHCWKAGTQHGFGLLERRWRWAGRSHSANAALWHQTRCADRIVDLVLRFVAGFITSLDSQINSARDAGLNCPEILPTVRQARCNRGPWTLRILAERKCDRAIRKPD